MKVSVLTVTKRVGWEKIAIDSLKAQTYRGFDWVIVFEEEPDFGVMSGVNILPIPAPPKLRLSNLNASLNEGLRYCLDSDYVIFYQDFIELPPDCFEKLLELSDDKTFVTTCTPNYDGSDDGRYTGKDSPRACRPEEWEANVSIAPMKLIKELGGFDIDYDNGWSWDNVNVAQRAAMLGAKFILDESNRPKLYPHEQADKENLPLNQKRHADTMKAIRSGTKPLRLNHL